MLSRIGLTNQDVSESLGFRHIAATVDCHMHRVILRNIATPFNLLNAVILSGLFAVYLAYRDERLLLDALGVTTVVVVNTVVAVIQEWRARRALEQVIVAQHPEPPPPVGTIVTLSRGSMVAADGVVVENHGCELDTAMVTGESFPVAVEVGMEIASGSFCLAGRASYRVTRSGGDHTTARIEQMARTLRSAPSPLQRSIDRVFQISFVAAVTLALVDVMLHLHSLGDIDVVRRIATLLLGMIPEGLVFFTTVALTMGVYRIAQRGVFVQRLNAVESFATVDTVCMDKTGTLTENQLSVHRIVPLTDVDATATLQSYVRSSGEHDQVTQALLHVPHNPSIEVTWVDAVPFSSSRKWSAQQQADGAWWMLGAPEVLLGSLRASELVAEHRLDLYRLLVFGTALEPQGQPVSFHPLLLIALVDRVRPDATELLAVFERSNINVQIITGDRAGAVQAVLPTSTAITAVHSRVSPEQKQNIVEQLQASGRHVAMIGDGVNDIPAIRHADVGIAVGSAAPATKEVADIVLEARSFDVLPEVIQEGRSTILTVLRVGQLYIGKNLALLAVTMLCTLSGLPFPLTPRRGALLSVIGVAIPAVVLAIRSSAAEPVTRFMQQLLGFSARTAGAAVLTTIGAWWWMTHVIGTAPAAPSVMFAAIIGVHLGAMLRQRHRVEITLVLVGLIAASILGLSALHTVPLPFSIITTFYEITPTAPTVLLWMSVWMVVGMIVMRGVGSTVVGTKFAP